MSSIPANPRNILILVLLPVLFFMGGCSLFGVATKGNLEDAVAAQETQNQQATAQMTELSNDLNAMETKLSSDLAALGSDVTQMRQTIVAAQQALQGMQFEMDALALEVEQAGLHGRKALDIHRENLVSERARLRMRLQQLDDQIMAWQQTLPPATTVVKQQQLQPSIVPEQPSYTETQPAQPKGEDETSVWDRQR